MISIWWHNYGVKNFKWRVTITENQTKLVGTAKVADGAAYGDIER